MLTQFLKLSRKSQIAVESDVSSGKVLRNERINFPVETTYFILKKLDNPVLDRPDYLGQVYYGGGCTNYKSPFLGYNDSIQSSFIVEPRRRLGPSILNTD